MTFCDIYWPLVASKWLVYQMYQYRAGKISIIKIQNRSAWNKNKLCYLVGIWYCNIVCFIVNIISVPNLKPTQISVSLTFKSDGPIIFWIKVSWNRLFTEDWTIGLISRYIYDFSNGKLPLWNFHDYVLRALIPWAGIRSRLNCNSGV